MNISEAMEQLESAVRSYAARGEDGMPLIPPEAQRPLYLIGPPGVGKTAIVRQVAVRLGVGLASYTMTHHTRQSALGLPRIVQRSFDGRECAYTEYTMSEIIAGIYRQMEETGVREGILFLDEINCVSETLMPAMLELLQHKRFGQHALPEGWIIVCAGNPEAYNRSAHSFDPVTLDRLRVVQVEPSLEAWMDYAAARGVHPAVRGFLRLRPEDFCMVEGERVVTPRSWTDLSDMMCALEALGEAPTPKLFEQYLQCPAVAEGFGMHFSMCRGIAERFSLDAVLRGENADAEAHFAAAPFDEALCAAMMLAGCLNGRAAAAASAEENADRLENFVEGVLREDGAWASVCRAHLQRMEHALKVRRSVGAVDPGVEAGERRLFRAVRAAMAVAAGAQDGAQALREAAAQRRERAMQMREDLRADFESALRFAMRAFANVHVRVIFLAELEQAPASLRFLKAELPEMLEALQRASAPDVRAAGLRKRLMDAEADG